MSKILEGNIAYKAKLRLVDISVSEVIKLNDEAIVKGALTSLDTVIIEKAKIELRSKNLEKSH